jgi:two-component system sensor histidine kinase KdpD
MAAVSALVWNFLFIPPRFTFHIADPQNVITFALFFVVAISMGHLTTRLRFRESELERHHLERTRLLAAKQRAEGIASSEQQHRTLLDSVSHELKTPLAIIRTALDGPGPSHPMTEEIDTATRRLQRLVDNLLEISRIESSSVRPHPDWCELRDVIDSAAASLERELRDHPLHREGIDDLPLLLLDARLMAQVVSLVLHNATIHAPENTPIEIAARVDGKALDLRLRDHGPGIAPWARDRIFEKFYRPPGAPAGGTGLGLAIARGMMKAQGGEITVSNHPEGGAEFRLTLPVQIRVLPPVHE